MTAAHREAVLGELDGHGQVSASEVDIRHLGVQLTDQVVLTAAGVQRTGLLEGRQTRADGSEL